MNRPRGLTIIGWLALIGGGLQILSSLGLVGIGSFGVLIGSTGMLGIAVVAGAGFAMWTGWALMALGVLGIVLGYGILQESTWAWTLGVTLYVLNLLAAFALLLLTGVGVTVWFVGILSAVVLGYLLTPTAREALGHSHGGGVSSGTPHPA
jgi:hypothetical protein